MTETQPRTKTTKMVDASQIMIPSNALPYAPGGIPVNGFLVSPSALDPLSGGGADFHAKKRDGISENHTLAIQDNPPIVTPVPVLCCVASPTAVSGAVSSAVVDAIKSEAGRSDAHICKELFKVLPFGGECDAATAVITPMGDVLVGATLYHGFPRGPRSAVGQPMRCATSAVQFLPIAAARYHFSPLGWLGNVAKACVKFFPAIASKAQAIHFLCPVDTSCGSADAYNDNTAVAVPDGDWFAESHGRIMPRFSVESNISRKEP